MQAKFGWRKLDSQVSGTPRQRSEAGQQVFFPELARSRTMTTPSRRLLDIFTKEDTPERQTAAPSRTSGKPSTAGVHFGEDALRGEVSNTPHKFRHSLHDAKTPQLGRGFGASGNGGSRSESRTSVKLRGNVDTGETLMESSRAPQFETIEEERGSPDTGLGLPESVLSDVWDPMEGKHQSNGAMESETTSGQLEFEEWIHQQASRFGRSYDEMVKEMEDEAVAFAHQMKREKEMMKEAEIEEKKRLLDDIEVCMPCEDSPSPVPSCVPESSCCESTDIASPITIRSLGSLPPFDIPEEPDFVFHDLEDIENGDHN